MFVCVRVCACVCVRVCMSMYAHEYAKSTMYVACVYVYTHACTHLRIYVIYVKYVFMHMPN